MWWQRVASSAVGWEFGDRDVNACLNVGPYDLSDCTLHNIVKRRDATQLYLLCVEPLDYAAY